MKPCAGVQCSPRPGSTGCPGALHQLTPQRAAASARCPALVEGMLCPPEGRGLEGCRYLLVQKRLGFAFCIPPPAALPCKAQKNNERSWGDLVQAPGEKYQGLRWKHSP